MNAEAGETISNIYIYIYFIHIYFIYVYVYTCKVTEGVERNNFADICRKEEAKHKVKAPNLSIAHTKD